MTLGRTVVGPVDGKDGAAAVFVAAPKVNTRTALWGERWPAIALKACIDEVEAAPKDEQAEVKRNLPCADCLENTRCLTAKRKELGPLLYDREILTEPRSSESSLFPLSLFAPMLRTDLAMVPSYPKLTRSRHEKVVSGWDIAWSEKVGGDRLVRCTALIDTRTMHKRLLNIQRYPEGMRYKQQLQQIELDHARFEDDLVVVESDAAQVIWSQTLEDSTDVPVLRHAAAEDKVDLQTGVPGILIDLDNQRWTFPYMEHGPGFGEIKAMLSEFAAFGYRDGKLEGVGAHDDMVMAFWHCWWGLKRLSSSIVEAKFGNQPGTMP
jgi:hypothetical protein